MWTLAFISWIWQRIRICLFIWWVEGKTKLDQKILRKWGQNANRSITQKKHGSPRFGPIFGTFSGDFCFSPPRHPAGWPASRIPYLGRRNPNLLLLQKDSSERSPILFCEGETGLIVRCLYQKLEALRRIFTIRREKRQATKKKRHPVVGRVIRVSRLGIIKPVVVPVQCW